MSWPQTQRALGVTPGTVAAGTDGVTADTARRAAWAAQAAWYIDATNGSDSNDGSASVAGVGAVGPLKTWGEYERRLRGSKLTIIQTVTVAGNLPSTDPLGIVVRLGQGGALRIIGKPASVAVGTFTAVTLQNPATQTPWSFADNTKAAAFWTGHIGHQIVITASAVPGNVGAKTWIAKDLGASAARIGQFLSVTADGIPYPTAVTPLVGDSYAVYDFGTPTRSSPGTSTVTFAGITIEGETGQNAPTGGFVYLQDLRLNGDNDPGVGALAAQSYTQFAASGVYFDGVLIAGYVVAQSSFITRKSAYVTYNALFAVYGGVVLSYPLTLQGGGGFFDFDVLAQSCQLVGLNNASRAWIASAAIFDAPGGWAGVEVFPGASVYQQPAFLGVDRLWGANNAASGVRVHSGGQYIYTTKPTVNTGGATEALVGGTSKLWAAIPFVNAANGAQIVVDQ